MSVLKTRIVHMYVLMALAVVAVFVLVLDVLMVVHQMCVHVCLIAMLVFVAVRCVCHVPLRSVRGGTSYHQHIPEIHRTCHDYFNAFLMPDCCN
ncbi:MAG: hypothetical protein ACRDSP_21725 [Pseudonocardiaceae bacterium]